MFCKKGVLRNFTKFTGKHLCQSLFLNKATCNFIKKETLAQVFSREFCEISKNSFFTEHLWAPASLLSVKSCPPFLYCELAYWNSWILDARVGRWALDAGLWTLDSGLWALDAGL